MAWLVTRLNPSSVVQHRVQNDASVGSSCHAFPRIIVHPPRQQPRCPAVKAAAGITHATNFHLVLHSVYKNPEDAKWEQLQLLEELTLQRLNDLNVDSLITVMFAFARSSYLPDIRIQQRMAAATETDMASFTPRQLEHAAWSLAHVRFKPSAEWLTNFAQALEVNWDYFRPAQLAVTLVEVASCGLTRLPRVTLTDQLPALLKKATAGGSAVAPGTLAKLVWSAGHFGYGDLWLEDVLAAAAAESDRPVSVSSSRPDSASVADADSEAASASTQSTGPADVAVAPAGRGERGIRAVPLPEQELLAWWEEEGLMEEAEPADLVLLLNGLARLGVQPAVQWTGRLLAALLGSPTALAQLDTRLLGLLAWSTLKVADGPLQREWLEAFVEALRARLRDDGGAQGEGALVGNARSGGQAGSTAGSAYQPSGLQAGSGAGEMQPADVALALSSLAGLGGYAVGEGDIQRYWWGAGRWSALSQEDRMVLNLLGYGP